MNKYVDTDIHSCLLFQHQLHFPRALRTCNRDWWTVSFSQSSAPRVNEQGPVGGNLFVS